MKLRWILFLLIGMGLSLCSPSVHAQGFPIENVVWNQNGFPVSGASITVCAGQYAGTPPCTSPATIYSDLALTQPIPNPITTGSLGDYRFVVAAGVYTVSITASGAGLTPTNHIIVVPFGSGSDAALKPAASDAVRFVSPNGNDANDGLSWGSAKATVAAAYAAEASTGGWIEVGCGTFSLSATLNLNTNNKPVKMIGSGPCTVFNYTPSTGTAILLDTGGGNPSQQSTLQNFTISTSVVGSTAIGLQVGSTNTAKYSTVRNVNITGFKTLAKANAFAVNWENVHLEQCSSASGSQAIAFGSLADDNHFTHPSFAGCVTMADLTGPISGPQWMEGPEFFASTSGETGVVEANSSILNLTSPHFVAEAGTGTPDFFSLTGNSALHLTNAVFEDDNVSGSYSSVGQVSNGFISINEAHVNFAGATTTNLVSISGTSGAYIADVNNDGSAVTGGIVNSSFSGPLTELGTQAFNGTAVGLKSSSVKLLSSGGGSITHQAPNTASNFTITDPAFATTLTGTVASGTATMTTGAIGSGACGATVTVSATGTLTTDTITYAFNAAVAANPGELTLRFWPTTGNVNFEYCNPTAGSITPTAATLNWRVVR